MAPLLGQTALFGASDPQYQRYGSRPAYYPNGPVERTVCVNVSVDRVVEGLANTFKSMPTDAQEESVINRFVEVELHVPWVE